MAKWCGIDLKEANNLPNIDVLVLAINKVKTVPFNHFYGPLNKRSELFNTLYKQCIRQMKKKYNSFSPFVFPEYFSILTEYVH